MSEERNVPPELSRWDLNWRLQKSLIMAEMSTQEMADELGVQPGTVMRWMKAKGSPPKLAFLKLWATRTNVPLVWLLGEEDGGNSPRGA